MFDVWVGRAVCAAESVWVKAPPPTQESLTESPTKYRQRNTSLGPRRVPQRSTYFSSVVFFAHEVPVVLLHLIFGLCQRRGGLHSQMSTSCLPLYTHAQNQGSLLAVFLDHFVRLQVKTYLDYFCGLCVRPCVLFVCVELLLGLRTALLYDIYLHCNIDSCNNLLKSWCQELSNALIVLKKIWGGEFVHGENLAAKRKKIQNVAKEGRTKSVKKNEVASSDLRKKKTGCPRRPQGQMCITYHGTLYKDLYFCTGSKIHSVPRSGFK